MQDAHLLDRAKRLRSRMSPFEAKLWTRLSRSQLNGHKFRRQHVIGNCIVDFFCPAKGLVIEVDGDTHDREADLRRDRRMLREFGFGVVRFTNEEIMTNCDGVLTALKIALDAQRERWPKRREHHPPTPSSKEEGEKRKRRRKAPSSLEQGVGGGGA